MKQKLKTGSEALPAGIGAKTGNIYLLASLILALPFWVAGSCNQTDIRGRGEIIAGQSNLSPGESSTLILTIPPALEGKIFNTHWLITPTNAGQIFWQQRKAEAPLQATEYTSDRSALFVASNYVASNYGKVRVDAFTIYYKQTYYKQTSPQRIASFHIRVTNDHTNNTNSTNRNNEDSANLQKEPDNNK